MKEVYSRYEKTSKEFIKNYSLNYDEKKVVMDVLGYFFNGPTSMDNKKGLMIRGNVGVGKTLMMKIIQKILNINKKFMYNHPVEIVNQVDRGSAFDIYCAHERCFDDIGTEPKANHYGKPIEVLEEIIYSRYDQFQSFGQRTFFTTNLTNDQLKEKYGQRAFDRLAEMVNVVVWPTTDSKRPTGIQADKRKEEFKKKEPSEKEKKQIERDYVNQLISDLEKCKEMNECIIAETMQSYMYKFLTEKGIVTFSDQQRTKSFEEEVYIYKKMKKIDMDMTERANVDSFIKNPRDPRNPLNEKVIIRAKRRLIREWIIECVEFGYDFKAELSKIL